MAGGWFNLNRVANLSLIYRCRKQIENIETKVLDRRIQRYLKEKKNKDYKQYMNISKKLQQNYLFPPSSYFIFLCSNLNMVASSQITSTSTITYSELDEALDRLMVMAAKEKTYLLHLNNSKDASSSNEYDFSNKTIVNKPYKKKIKYTLSPVTVIDDRAESAICKTKIRNEACRWMYKVVDYYSYDRNIVAIALNFFDRYLANSQTLSSFASLSHDDASMKNERYELVTATSLYLAIKLFGPRKERNENLLLRSFVLMSDSRFQDTHITNMESQMLNALKWKVHPITSQDFVHCFLQFLCQNNALLSEANQNDLIDLSIYIVELIAMDSQFSFDTPSTIACACIALALKGIQLSTSDDICTTTTATLLSENQRVSFLLPLFQYGFVTQINDTIEKIHTYLSSISLFLDEDELAVDPTGILFHVLYIEYC
mmetsp:Transcript_19066/g.22036  ORF Transcript_19066/g.22036 Transcript_19066/m.22036 type:complete len:430 (-) Transcript_19066:116-1405(-)